MEISMNLKDIVQLAVFAVTCIGAVWKVSGILNEMKTKLEIIAVSLSHMSPQIVDHENRIRVLEKLCNTHIDVDGK